MYKKSIKCDLLEYSIYASELKKQFFEKMKHSLGEGVRWEGETLTFHYGFTNRGINYTIDNYLFFRWVKRGCVIFDRQNRSIDMRVTYTIHLWFTFILFVVALLTVCLLADLPLPIILVVAIGIPAFLFLVNYSFFAMAADAFVKKCIRDTTRALRNQLE